MSESVPGLLATNGFYYYKDLDAAYAFYRDILGLETAADYGFAKIMRVAANTYLTLVDVEQGMHNAEEPKSVTLAMVTDEVEEWYNYLVGAGVTMHKGYSTKPNSNHDGFVALDPEGYFLEFEIFNPHPENESLLPILAAIEPLYTGLGSRPATLGIRSTVMWLYYQDMARMMQFWESLFGVELMVDQGWAKVYQMAGSGFIGLVDGEKGLHETSPEKCVTVSFFTRDVEGWFARASAQDGLRLRTTEIGDESGKVKIFVGYDPEGYFLEWDTFVPDPANETLLKMLG